MERYGVIKEKRKREIVLLRGRGCIYKKCAFCDYHLDSSFDDGENFLLNKSVLDRVTGYYGELEVINSGSVFELDEKTLDYIKSICKERKIRVIHFEAHYLYREKIPKLRESFKGFELKMKLGLETFDYNLRENILKKGINSRDEEEICKNFDEANFLFGISGQTIKSMERDILLGIKNFERICINVMCPNSTGVSPDKTVIADFINELYPKYKDDKRIDILINNTDFGVG